MNAKALLIEDSSFDIKMFRKAFADEPFDFSVARDGEAGLAEAQRTHPDIIFLDVNMPRKRGDEVLFELKTDPLTRTIRVVILTNSDNPDDVKRCLGLHADSYYTKPRSMAGFKRFAKSATSWWLDSVLL